MAGLMPKGQVQGGAPQMPGAPVSGGAGAPPVDGGQVAGGEMGEEQPNVSPEEQAQYDLFVSNGMKLLYSERTMQQFLKSIAGDGDPVEGLANSLSATVMRLEDSAKQSGQEISGDVMLHGASELAEMMAELATAAGAHEFEPEQVEAGFLRAVDMYRVARQEQGALPMDEINADMQGLMAADQQGKLGEVLPGIDQFAEKAPDQGPQQQGQRRDGQG